MSPQIYQHHSVIVSFSYNMEDDQPFYELSDLLFKTVTLANVGIYDGHEIALDNGDGSYYMYGPNAETLFKAVKPIMESFAFMRGAIAWLRFGPGENAMAIDVELGAA